MFKFGKKVSYRPLIIGSALGLLLGKVTYDVVGAGNSSTLQQWFWTILIGAIFFSIIVFFHYLPNYPLEFSYWEVDHDTFKYVDTGRTKNKIISLLIPTINPLTSVSKADIASITLVGNINKSFEAPMMVPVTAAMGAFYAGIAMVHNPNYVRLTLKTGQTIDLSIRRDYTYSRTKTIVQLNQLFESLNDSNIKVELPDIHQTAQRFTYNY